MPRFEEINPTKESYWRSIILFGHNVAYYQREEIERLLLKLDAGEIVNSGETKMFAARIESKLG